MHSNYQPNLEFLDNTPSHRLPGVEIDPTADIHPNVYFEGVVRVGPYCRIEAGTILKGNITVGSHTIIGCNVSLRGNITIGKQVRIFDQVNIEGGRPGEYVGSSTALIPDRAFVGDYCVISHGTVMHGTQIGAETVIGMRCVCDYNTRIGGGVILASGSATNVDQIISDDCFAEGVPAQIRLHEIPDAYRREYLGYLPNEKASQTAFELEAQYRNGIRASDRNKTTKLDIHPTATIHPTVILEGNIKIGAYTLIAAGSILTGEITIGDYSNITLNTVVKGIVSIGDEVHVFDNVVIDGTRSLGAEVHYKRSDGISIGSRSWINHGCAIRGCDIDEEGAVNLAAVCDYNSRVGRGAIISSCSAVGKMQFVPADCFAEGVPVVIESRNLTNEDRQNYFGLLPSKWVHFFKSILEQMSNARIPPNRLSIDENAFIHPKAWLEGNITVGPYTYVDAGTILSGNISIGHHTLLRCNISVRGTITIGNYTHIYDQVNIEGGRPGKLEGSVTCEDPDKAVIGDSCWLNHGCIMHGTSIGDGGAVNLGAACDYNTSVGKGAIVGNRTATHVDQRITDNWHIVGVPQSITNKFVKEEDRHRYFGLRPSCWTKTESKWIEEGIRKSKKK